MAEEAAKRAVVSAKQVAAAANKLDKLKRAARRAKSTAGIADEAVKLMAGGKGEPFDQWTTRLLPYVEATDGTELVAALRRYIAEHETSPLPQVA